MRSPGVGVGTRRILVARILLILPFLALSVRAAHLAVDERGIERGEFRPQDARQAATSITVATLMFCVPTFMQEPLESMEAKLNGLLELLHEGLKA